MIALPAQRRAPDRERIIRIEGASANNLHEVDAEFPVGLFTCRDRRFRLRQIHAGE